MDSLWQQLVTLFILAIPVACVARTVVFEEIFREPREWCKHKSQTCSTFFSRKFFYLFTCEYCFSHWVTILFLVITRFKLLYPDWRGYLVSFFSLVFVANAYMNLYSRLRVEITSEKKQIETKEKESRVLDKELEAKDREIQKLDVELEEVRANSANGRSGNRSGGGAAGR